VPDTAGGTMRPPKPFQEANYKEGASSCSTDGRTSAKSSPEVARGGKMVGRSVAVFVSEMMQN